MGDTGWSVVFKDCPTCFSEETVVGEFNCNCSLRKPWSGENISLKNSLHMLKPTNTLNTSRKKKKVCHYKTVQNNQIPKIMGKDSAGHKKIISNSIIWGELWSISHYQGLEQLSLQPSQPMAKPGSESHWQQEYSSFLLMEARWGHWILLCLLP